MNANFANIAYFTTSANITRVVPTLNLKTETCQLSINAYICIYHVIISLLLLLHNIMLMLKLPFDSKLLSSVE